MLDDCDFFALPLDAVQSEASGAGLAGTVPCCGCELSVSLLQKLQELCLLQLCLFQILPTGTLRSQQHAYISHHTGKLGLKTRTHSVKGNYRVFVENEQATEQPASVSC